jgi:GNAT superfamily N-acetyltransferase
MPNAIKRLSWNEMDRAAVVMRIAFNDRLPWLADIHTPEEDRAFFRDNVWSRCEVWGAFNDEMIGFIAFAAEWIDHLYVLPESQRQGTGRALLEVAKTARTCLQLWTFQKNLAARAFYEKSGFIAVTMTDGSRNEEREPDVLYQWRSAEP